MTLHSDTPFNATRFSAYPMGPTLRDFLGISPADYKGENAQISASDSEDFAAGLLEHLQRQPIPTREVLIDLLEELTAMGLGRMAIALRELNPDFNLDDDFRSLLALGSATMLEGEFSDAESLLQKAHFLAPEESAPYLNLAEIYYATERDTEALHWASAGAKIEPNRARLWELIASVHLHAAPTEAASKVRALAMSLDSFAGLSLAADILDARDPLLKAQFLAELYDQGNRDPQFLIEYTATLGLAQQYEKVPALVWEFEKIGSTKAPWQLLAHAAQAHFALEQEAQAEDVLRRLERLSDCPKDVVLDLRRSFDPPAETGQHLH